MAGQNTMDSIGASDAAQGGQDAGAGDTVAQAMQALDHAVQGLKDALGQSQPAQATPDQSGTPPSTPKGEGLGDFFNRP
jgi:hypothetical protein